MCPIAEILKRKGYEVTGSDTSIKKNTEHLTDLGIKIFYGQKAENVTDQDIIIYTTAIQGDNPEFRKAQETGKTMYSRPVMLGKILSEYKNRITVSGVHGKTTTTAIIDKILHIGNKNNTSLIGSPVSELNGNLRYGTGDTILTEACEAFKSFLHLHPSVAVLTNIDGDHLDHYGTIDNIEATFRKFATENVDSEGTIIYNGDDIRLCRAVKDSGKKLISYGLGKNCDFRAENIQKQGIFITYDLYINQKFADNIKLRAMGEHNVYNSLAATACGYIFDIDLNIIKSVLENFNMPDRRFNIIYNKEITVVDDYAHHPTEIRSTLTAAKEHFSENRITAVFQPHLYTRTQQHFKAFANALQIADRIIVTDIYAARELPIEGVTCQIILDEIKDKKAEYCKLSEISDLALSEKQDGDIFIFLGAGDIFKAAYKLKNKLEKNK